MSRIVLFAGGANMPWLRIEDGAIAERGEDHPPADVPATVVIPSDQVSWRTIDATALSPAQALVAARLDAAESSLGDPSDRHVAVVAGGHAYVLTSRSALRTLLAEMTALEMAVDTVLPSPALLPEPDEGFVRAALPLEVVLRSASGGLREDGAVSALVVGEAPLRTLSEEEVDASILAAAEQPGINLLQGEFAPRTQWVADPGYWMRMARYAGIALALTLAIPVAKWVKLGSSTASLDREASEIAARALGEAAAGPDAALRLRNRLAERRGAGAGFVPTEAVLARVIEMQPNAELSMMAFEPDGTMRATLRGTSQADLDAVRTGLESAGFAASLSGQTGNQGRLQAELSVRPR
jgi:general secretion pathway protein L